MSVANALFRLRGKGLVTMGATGQWELTGKGHELIEEIAVLDQLVADDRTPARDMRDPRGMTAEDARADRREGGD